MQVFFFGGGWINGTDEWLKQREEIELSSSKLDKVILKL
jgi:hypothetical protein